MPKKPITFMTIGIWGNNRCCISVTEERSSDVRILWINESEWIASRHTHIIEQAGKEVLFRRRRMIVVYKGLEYDPDLTEWKYDTKKGYRVSTSRYNTKFAVLKERGPKCWYCNSDEATTVDHFIPASKGGGSGLDNLVPACKWCNENKGASMPIDWIGVEKYNRFMERLKQGHEAFTNPYCDSRVDRELFEVVTSTFSRSPNATVIPGVVAKAVMRYQRALTITNAKIARRLTNQQALNISMTHPLEGMSMAKDACGLDVPNLAQCSADDLDDIK